MPARVSMPLLLLAVMTGCTTFGPDGTLPMALHRDMVNRQRTCDLSTHDWLKRCGNDFWLRPREEQIRCPLECQPAEEEE